jgi:predicted Zn finger-like uncharacterized protein
MLIVCPSCATSYMIDPDTLGASGRTVRCARCKVTWFATPEKSAELTEFVDGEIAEAETRTAGEAAGDRPHPFADNAGPPDPSIGSSDRSSIDPFEPAAADEDDFGLESPLPIGEIEPADGAADSEAPPVPPPPADLDAIELDAAEATAEMPETVTDAPPLAPPAEHEIIPDRDAPDETLSDDIESYTARRQRMQARRRQKRRSTRWIAIALILFVINAAVIVERETVVRHLPQTASLFAAIGLPVNLRHLSFENVKVSKDVQDGVNVLVVHGAIVSTASKPVTVPRLRFAARDASDQEIYTWTALPTRSILGPGERLEFRTRLASPPADARNVMVRFFNSSDTSSGAD